MREIEKEIEKQYDNMKKKKTFPSYLILRSKMLKFIVRKRDR